MKRAAPLLTSVMLAHAAAGDAGAVRAHVEAHDLAMTVFTEPTPPRVGLLDLSVMLQHAPSDELLFGSIDAVLTDPQGAVYTVTLTRTNATTSFMQASEFTLPRPGHWHVEVTAQHDDATLQARFQLDVAKALPRWREVWPWALPVPVTLILIALARRK